jgi:hypothetical protein
MNDDSNPSQKIGLMRLVYELQRAEMLQSAAVLDEQIVDRIDIQPSKDINNYDNEVTYRFVNNGGEPWLGKTTIRRRVLLSMFGEVA